MADNEGNTTRRRRGIWPPINHANALLGSIAAVIAILGFIGGAIRVFSGPPSRGITHVSNVTFTPTATTALLPSPTVASTPLPTVTPTPRPTPTPTPTPSPTPTHTTTPDALYDETAGPYGSGTFTDYTNAGGTQGKGIAAYGTIEVSCRVTGWQRSGSPSGDDWWYRVQSSPWSNQFYAYADNFYNNGQTSGPINNGVLVDTSVPLCG